MINGEQHGDGGVASRRSGRHAAPVAGRGASVRGPRARVALLIVAATGAAVTVVGGAMAVMLFAGAPQAVDEAADVVATTRPASTDPASPTRYAPILPSPGPSPSINPTNPTSPAEDLADPATDAPTDPATGAPADPADEPATGPTPTGEPGRETAPGPTNRPDEPNAPEDPEDTEEDCVEDYGFLGLGYLFLGPSCP